MKLRRRQFLQSAAAGMLAASLPTHLFAADRLRKPNVLFIMADDLGWRDTGAYGSLYFDTPNIDRLASRGMLFTQAYASAPSCTPSRYALMTGLHPARTGITHIPWFNQFIGKTWPIYSLEAPPIPDRLPADVDTIAHMFKRAGYATGQWGKWHMGNPPAEFGFDMGGEHKSGIHDFPGASTAPRDNNREVWDKYLKEFPDLKEGEYAEAELVNKALEFIGEHREQPWFYYYDPLLVHTPILNRQKWLIDKYTQRFQEMGVTDVNPTYGAMVETLDWTVGRLIDGLEKLGLHEDTMIIFTSDNGGLEENVGWPYLVTENAPLHAGKVSLYEGGIRVPLIVDWPGVTEPASKSNALVQTIDFFPTFLEILGASKKDSQRLDGVSLVPILGGRKESLRGEAFWHFPHFVNLSKRRPVNRISPYVGVLRQGDWKLMLHYSDESVELYNLSQDIGEEHDLSWDLPEKATAMKGRLKKLLEEYGARMPVANPNFQPNGKVIR